MYCDLTKEQILSILKEYDVQQRSFPDGDWGSLDQIIFESSSKGGVIDFWGLGWIGIRN
jgi:hypothetical protein